MHEAQDNYDLPEKVEDGVEVSLRNSILLSIKKLIGLDREYDAFDDDLIMHINSVFMVLNQLGVGDKVFMIGDETNTWDEFFAVCGVSIDVSLIKSYIYLKVKLLFDPPSTGVLHEAMERQIAEFEWRLNAQCDPVFQNQNANGGEVIEPDEPGDSDEFDDPDESNDPNEPDDSDE